MPKVRIELVTDFGAKKGQVQSGIVVDSNYDAVLKAAQNKLQLKKKDLTGLTLSCVDFAGVRVLPEGDVSEILQNGAKVLVSRDDIQNIATDAPAAPATLTRRLQKAVDELQLVPEACGALAARGKPNLETLLALQSRCGITTVVTLLRHDECSAAAKILSQGCERLGLRWCHAPLPGPKEMGMIGNAPARLTVEDIESFRKVQLIRQWLEAGEENVVVHCAAGLHRTGIFLYVLLRELGHPPTEALDRIRQMRQSTFDEFKRLNFEEKAEAIFAFARTGSLSAEGGGAVELMTARAGNIEPEAEEDEDSDEG